MKIQDLLVEYETHTYTDDQGNVWRVNDEGDKELIKAAPGSSYGSRYPRRSPAARPTGMYFYNVPAGKENDAKATGLMQSKSGKWYSTFRNSWAEKAFGPGKYWQPKSEESVTAGATGSSAVPSAPGKGRLDSIVV